MHGYQREFTRLTKIKELVCKKFPYFGPNKKQEIERLLYEVSKRENISPANIMRQPKTGDFDTIKQYLISRRFPRAIGCGEISGVYLPGIELAEKNTFNLSQGKFYPKKIFIEEVACGSYLIKAFQNASRRLIFSKYLRSKITLSSKKDTIFVIIARGVTAFLS